MSLALNNWALSKIAADNILKLTFLSCQKIGFDMQIVFKSTREKYQNLFSAKIKEDHLHELSFSEKIK